MSCVTRRRFARPPCEDPRDSARLGNIGNLDFLSALTCPTPNHYSIIYYRSSLWESKHRSHVTLCDHSSEGGDSSSSSSPCVFLLLLLPLLLLYLFFLLFRSSASSLFILPLFHSALRSTPFTRRRRGVYAGRDFLARRTRRRDGTWSFFLRIARAGNKLRRQICVRERLLTARHAVLAFGCIGRLV